MCSISLPCKFHLKVRVNQNMYKARMVIEYNDKLCLNIFIPMPKLKSRKAAAKRFRATGSGKIFRRKAFKSHLLEHKSADRRRNLSQSTLVDERDEDRVRGMLPYL
jgi:large subunit ribosomal protein L35